ncbi:unnamed protein product [Trichobilharzia szidati]|nr:unnamed protein product [Trichobilharzia szidati]
METISVNNGTTFSQSPQVYKFITECPDYLSSSGNDFSCSSSNSNHCDSDSEFDSHGGGIGGGTGVGHVGSNDVHMTMNLPEGNSPTSTVGAAASLSCIHPSPTAGSKRRLVVSSNTDDTISATAATRNNNNSNTPLVFTQQSSTFSSDEQHYLPGEKLTRGKQKIPIEFISERTKRYSTFSKRKTGLMKKAVELAELTGAEVLLLVASETNHVYTFATQRLKGIIELECGKKLIQTCLSSSGNSANLSMMKTHCQDLNINTTNTNNSIRSQNVNESDSGCKKERDTTTTSTTTGNSVSSIDTTIHKDPVESTDISDKNTTVIPNSNLAGGDDDGTLLQISNLNPNDISQDSSQLDCSNVSLEHGIITDNNNNNSNNNMPQITYTMNPSETNHQMVYVPVSVFPNPLTPLSSNILLTTAQMTAVAATGATSASSTTNTTTITNTNTLPHQLLFLPQFTTLPAYSIPSNPVVFNSNLSTLNQLNVNLVNFLNVNGDIHNTNTVTNNNNSNGPVEVSTNSTTPPSPSPPLTAVTTQSNNLISEISQYKKEFM